MGAVSSGVLVPSLMELKREGYGLDKEIPDAMIAATSFDDILGITMFGIFKTIAFNELGVSDEPVGIAFVVTVGEIVLGVFIGTVMGSLMYLKCIRTASNKVKAFICVTTILGMILFTELVKCHESKFLASVFFGYVCKRVWTKAANEEIRQKKEH